MQDSNESLRHLETPIKSGFPGGSLVKNLPSVQETWIRSLDQEDPLESETAPDSSIPAWRIPCTEEPGRLQSMGSQRVRHTTEQLTLFKVTLPIICQNFFFN